MNARRNWERHELLLAFGLYCQMPFGKMHSRNPTIIEVAESIGRTPSAVAMKLVNIASLDPELTATGRKGLSGASMADKQMWREMNNNWGTFVVESSKALGQIIPEQEDYPKAEIKNYSGHTKETKINARIGQQFFRKSVLSAYNSKCCISGLSMPKLLVASHIVPWREDTENRLNPSNGLCLSVLHDKAFDMGLIAIQDDMTIIISEKDMTSDEFYKSTIKRYEGKTISCPDKFKPSSDFLVYHRDNIFQG